VEQVTRRRGAEQVVHAGDPRGSGCRLTVSQGAASPEETIWVLELTMLRCTALSLYRCVVPALSDVVVAPANIQGRLAHRDRRSSRPEFAGWGYAQICRPLYPTLK
jgi:hypothetical protein